MSGLHRHLLLAVILLLFGTQLGQSLQVQFYSQENYEGLIEEKVLSEDNDLQCIHMESSNGVIKSVKTDKCLILYQGINCQKGKIRGYIFGSFDFQPSYRIDGDAPSTGKSQYVYSYHVCSQKLGGGPQLDLTIIKAPLPLGSSMRLAEPFEFEGVCDCTNVPTSFVGGNSIPILIDGHGNSVNLYEGENCQGDSTYLSADETINSLENRGLKFDMKSFQPAELNNCSRLSSVGPRRVSIFSFLQNTFLLLMKQLG